MLADYDGSIPACAGETTVRGLKAAAIEVYPRVCGGNPANVTLALPKVGLSPRVRGKLARFVRLPLQPGSIPACAGETQAATTSPTKSAVYPRVCGGNPDETVREIINAGLSPRVRGKRCGWLCP